MNEKEQLDNAVGSITYAIDHQLNQVDDTEEVLSCSREILDKAVSKTNKLLRTITIDNLNKEGVKNHVIVLSFTTEVELNKSAIANLIEALSAQMEGLSDDEGIPYENFDIEIDSDK